MSYKLKLDIFEGPLDLLLYLIKKNDLDICNIPIASVTEQYLQYIEMMKMLDLEVVGDFLVMAATLMQIKSRMLLPPDPTEVAPQEDPRDELVKRLQEYQRFKEIADALKEKESLRQDLFSRTLDEAKMKELKEDAREVYFDASLFDLINAFSEALKRAPEEVIHEIIKDEFTVDKKIHEVLHLLLDCSQVLLNEIFNKCRNKIEIVVTFLAILELMRLKEIKIVQKSLFGEIEVLRNKENIAPPTEQMQESQESQENQTAPESQEDTNG